MSFLPTRRGAEQAFMPSGGRGRRVGSNGDHRAVLFCLGHCLAGHWKDYLSLGNGTTGAVASAVY